MHRRILNITLIMLLSWCISCGNKAGNIGFGPPEREIEKLYKRANATYNRLVERRIRNSPRNWNNVIRQFGEIVEDHPGSRVADDAQYNLGLCYIQARELLEDSPQKAVMAFEKLIVSYPDSEFMDDAHYWKAYAHSLDGNYEIAAEEYEEFTRKYPQSELREEAVSRMEECRSKLGYVEESQPEERPALAASEDEIPEPMPVEEADSDEPEVSVQQEDIRTESTTEANPPSEMPVEESVTPQEQEDMADTMECSHVENVRFHSSPEFTRVVMDLDGPVEYKIGSLKNPDRIYVDLQTAVVTPAKQTIEVSDKTIETIRVAQFDKSTTRMVLDIKKIGDYSVSCLKDPDRLVVDVYRPLASPDVLPSESKSPDHQESVPLARQLGLKIKTIVIDPGHGGKDPGAVSSSGMQEKPIVLDIAKRLQKLLESRGIYRVHLTRETNVFIPLGERTAFANERDADIFISIHINSCGRPKVRGIETYYLSLASDEDARATAALENASAEKTMSDLSSMLRHILHGAKVDESQKLAQIIQARLCHHTGATDRGVKRAPFIVLIGAEAPSVLVELGFMSNSHDEGLLRDAEYREKLAQALMEAVEIYIGTMKPTS